MASLFTLHVTALTIAKVFTTNQCYEEGSGQDIKDDELDLIEQVLQYTMSVLEVTNERVGTVLGIHIASTSRCDEKWELVSTGAVTSNHVCIMHNSCEVKFLRCI